MPERKTRKVSKRDAHDFLSKAEQFLRHSWGLGDAVTIRYLAPKLVLGHTNIRHAEHLPHAGV